MLGLPDADATQLSRWSSSFFRLFAPFPSEAVRAETDAALAEFRLYLAELLRARRAAPGEDLISRLAAAEAGGERLTDEQVIDNAMLLFSDGIENIDAAIGNLVLALHRHPAALAALRTDCAEISSAVEEGLRYDSPAQLIARVAREDLEIGGRAIKRDSAVFLALGSANRDPELFEQPERFELTRQNRDIVSFGKGRHSCIGATLVRIEMQAALSALLNASRSFEVGASDLEWVPRFGHRWLKTLPMTLQAA
jgi:cytochrome P450